MVKTRVAQGALIVQLLVQRVVGDPSNHHIERRFQPFIKRIDRSGAVMVGQ